MLCTFLSGVVLEFPMSMSIVFRSLLSFLFEFNSNVFDVKIH